MATVMPHEVAGEKVNHAWAGFKTGLWQKEINVRDFIQQNYEPYEGDASFLAPATERTQKLWARLNDLFVEERKLGVLDISQIPSSITAHGPGYIDRENEIIVGLQTEAPLKRAIMPQGGLRMVLNALKAYGYEPDPQVVEAFTKYRKTHNSAVFDAYTEDIRQCRSSHILTGLPDAYGRGRIIGDYRRVALYGVARLIERKTAEKRRLDPIMSTDEVIREREELAEQIRALNELQQMAARYGFDISLPAESAREAVRCLWAAPPPSLISTSRATWAGARSPNERCRRSLTILSSSCASFVSCARRSTTSFSRAIPPGSQSQLPEWETTGGPL
jgi:formate C-acetyltransferase